MMPQQAQKQVTMIDRPTAIHPAALRLLQRFITFRLDVALQRTRGFTLESVVLHQIPDVQFSRHWHRGPYQPAFSFMPKRGRIHFSGLRTY